MIKIELPIDEIVHAYKRGVSCVMLSYQYFVHENTIRNLLKKAGVSKSKPNKDTNKGRLVNPNLIINMYLGQGLSTRYIAEYVGTSKGTIATVLKEQGIILRKNTERGDKYAR